ncbi:MAG: sulfatase [Polyangiaceae bacterium]|nr:sulfatase [Polyangiaceae bacterium]
MAEAARARPEEGRAALGAADAQLVAWALLGAVNAAVIAATSEAPSARTRALHHLFDAGHLLAGGLAASAMVGAWARAPAPLRRRGLAALAALSAALGWALLQDDVRPRAAKLAGGGASWPWALALALAISAGVPIAAAAGRALRRGALRIAAAGAGLVAAAANHFVLERDYPGVHLFVALAAAALLGSSLIGIELDHAPAPRPRLRLAAALLAAATVVIAPPGGVLVEMLRRSGSVLAPFLARARAAAPRLGAPTPGGGARGARPGAPPTAPRLLPADGVVVLLTVDCLRADLLDGPGASRLPSLSRLAAEAARFTGARTPAPATMVALSSLFTGRYYSQLRWSAYRGDWEVFPHDDPSPRFPELLARAGVPTVAIQGMDWMDPGAGVLRGFTEVIPVRPTAGRVFATSAEAGEALRARLARHGAGPLFAYAHFLDAHAPYDLAGAEGSDLERYLGELALVDAEIGRITDAIDAAGLRERTALIVSADHGEAFGEHGARFHGVTLYEELVRVPLLVRAPGVAPRRVDAPVSLVDLGPTILDLAGLPAPGSFMGATLAPLLRGGAARPRRPVAMDSGRRMQARVFEDGFKVIRDLRRGTAELYDLAADPGESRNLYDDGGLARPHLEELDRFFAENALPGYEPPFRPP